MLADPGTHFKGRYEVEMKFRVEHLGHVRRRLDQSGAVPFALDNVETDVFFDFPDGRLEANHQFHTLRQMRPSGRVLWISKGPAADQCIAMDLSDFDRAAEMLTSLGFVEMRRIGKKRDIYFTDEFHVTLDDVDGLGPFVEIAVMTDDRNALAVLRERVREAAGRLDLLRFAEETRSYRQMLFG